MSLTPPALTESSKFDVSKHPASVRQVLSLLSRVQVGTLELRTPEGQTLYFGTNPEPKAQLTLYTWDAATAALKSGDIGFAEAYMTHSWTSEDLAGLLRFFIANRNAIEDAIYGHWLWRWIYKIKHLLNRNTKTNSKKNIHAHYDLGNSFYELWLDSTMNYSSALFEGNMNQALSDAQSSKVARALRMVGVQKGERLLEIGCGWGALAEMAIEKFDAQVTGVTLSSEQLDFANRRMKERGLAERADLRLQDYRDIDDGPYDCVCSIEMFEAVGQAYWDSYFKSIAALLKKGGKACIQTIVIDDALFERYLSSSDFIQQYIFPGGCLPCASEFRKRAEGAGLTIIDELRFGPDYAETLRRWRHDFMKQEALVKTKGFDDRFIKLWEFYLAYCEAAFDGRNTDVIQFTLLKPN